MLKTLKTLIVIVMASGGLLAQVTFPVNGVKDDRIEVYAFVNATIYKDYQTVIENATLLIKEGKVIGIGQNVAVPQEAIVRNLQGKYVYPGLVDIYSHYGLPPVQKKPFNFFAAPQMKTKKEGAYAWNQTIRPETDATMLFKVDDKMADGWRKQGFTSVLTHSKDGIARGSSVLVTLAGNSEHEVILKERASAHYSFDRGSSTQLYPTSIMGSMALLRQTYYDTRWYMSLSEKPLNNQSLQAFNDLQGLPQIFDASHKLNTLLADKLGDEFDIQYTIKGAGDEYQRLQEIKETGAKLIIPINYPDAYTVEDPLATLDVSLAEMKHWELAPSNAAMLKNAGIDFAITADGLSKPGDFWNKLRLTVNRGLSKSDALKAVTYTPASILGVLNQIGTLNTGSVANFFIASDDIFEKSGKVHETWIQGESYVTSTLDLTDFSGKYDLSINDGGAYKLEISGVPPQHRAKIVTSDTTHIKVKVKTSGDNINISFNPNGGLEGTIRLSGWKTGGDLRGNGQLVTGSWATWLAKKTGDLNGSSKKNQEPEEATLLGKVIYPFVAYGTGDRLTAGTYLIRNTTVWTNESDGVLQNADVLIRDGKISQVGQNLSVTDATVIDGEGKHLTSGIIDEHSHVALRGVNEASEAITAEVRMYDAIDSEDIDIYRQLAGGVTAAQLLHGSANPVGGQSALVKFRWGVSPEEMKIQGADGYIKFALGENVKQSNRPRSHNVRYPQTRMGVEQIFIDGFTRAKEYDAVWRKYNQLSSRDRAKTTPPRKDIELEALAEIIRKERFISCHSYVQSEINMLMKVAEKFDFQVNTFTHILEGYKVADKMKEHGAGGSTFSDWWAYKWEVKEAIPYNPALMAMVGVITAINSDDGEMARRLNQEAAKSVKYAGMSEEEALKMVTLNPAKLLHLDDRMGSIKVGKDADMVLWNDHPLSIYAKPEKTIIDGVIYYDIKRDQELRKSIEQERARLIAKMQSAKNTGKPSTNPKPKGNKDFHCDDLHVSNDYTLYK